MNEVFLSLGSNLGDRRKNLSVATTHIEVMLGSTAVLSGIYETAAWGKTDQNDFLNMVLCIKSAVTKSTDLLEYVRDIEEGMGRVRHEKWGPRTIDIDILFFAGEILSTENLVIPHPRIPERNFVLAPMVELAPEFVHPVLLKTMAELYRLSEDKLEVKRLID